MSARQTGAHQHAKMKQPSIQKQEASLVRTTHANLRRHHAHQSTSTEGQGMSSAIGAPYKGRSKQAFSTSQRITADTCAIAQGNPLRQSLATTIHGFWQHRPQHLHAKITAQKSPHAYAGFSKTLSANRAVKRRRGYFFLRFADFERFDFWRCVDCFVACAGCTTAAAVAFSPESSAETSAEAP